MASFGVPGRPEFLFGPRDLLRDRLRGILVMSVQVVRGASARVGGRQARGAERTALGSSSRLERQTKT